MPVNYFVWGQRGGGGGGGEGTGYATTSGPPEVFSGSLGVGVTNISFSNSTTDVYVFNTDDADNFEVSFDGGATYLEIYSLRDLHIKTQVDSITLRSTVANVTYKVIAVLDS